MNSAGYSRAEILVGDMKHSIDTIWTMCRKNVPLNTLMYASESSDMQYTEMLEIIRMLGCLKRQIDNFSDTCLAGQSDALVPVATATHRNKSRIILDLLKELLGKSTVPEA